MSTTTEDIKARLSIVEVVGQYVRLQKAGRAWKANCPFHQEKTPSFNVNEERQMWHCFGCGKGGDAFAFIMEIEGLEFREALTLLAEKAGVELPEYRGKGQVLSQEKDRGLEILDLATKFYVKQLWESIPGKKSLEYLRARGLSDESIRTYSLGYAPDGWEHLTKFLVSRGFQGVELERCGLSLRGKEGRGFYDRFRDRIMFPIHDIIGRTIGYSARVAPGGDESQAKYINTPETNLYHKSRALYGLALAKQSIKETGRIVLVEGNMDVIALHQAGISNTVAVSGTALTGEQLAILKRYGRTLSLFFDMDTAGQAAAWKSLIAAQSLDFLVESISLPSGKDAADVNRENPDLLREAVERAEPAMQYFLRSLTKKHDSASREGRRAIVERYTELLAATPNDLDRAHWMKELAETVGSDPKLIQSTVEQAMRAMNRPERFVESRPTTSFAPKTFGRRSEVLREGIVGLVLAAPGAWQYLEAYSDTAVRDFVRLHPLVFFIQNNSSDPVAAIEDRALQEMASELLFRTLELPRFQGGEIDRDAVASEIMKEYLADLERELHGRDERLDLGRAIEAARQVGNKEEERRLLEAFARLTRSDASQNE